MREFYTEIKRESGGDCAMCETEESTNVDIVCCMWAWSMPVVGFQSSSRK